MISHRENLQERSGEVKEEKLRGVAGVFFKLSEALMCPCPAKSKEIGKLSAVPGGVCREVETNRGQRDGVKGLSKEGGTGC